MAFKARRLSDSIWRVKTILLFILLVLEVLLLLLEVLVLVTLPSLSLSDFQSLSLDYVMRSYFPLSRLQRKLTDPN